MTRPTDEEIQRLEDVRAAGEALREVLVTCDKCSNIALARRPMSAADHGGLDLCLDHLDHNDSWSTQKCGPELEAFWKALAVCGRPARGGYEALGDDVFAVELARRLNELIADQATSHAIHRLIETRMKLPPGLAESGRLIVSEHGELGVLGLLNTLVGVDAKVRLAAEVDHGPGDHGWLEKFAVVERDTFRRFTIPDSEAPIRSSIDGPALELVSMEQAAMLDPHAKRLPPPPPPVNAGPPKRVLERTRPSAPQMTYAESAPAIGRTCRIGICGQTIEIELPDGHTIAELAALIRTTLEMLPRELAEENDALRLKVAQLEEALGEYDDLEGLEKVRAERAALAKRVTRYKEVLDGVPQLREALERAGVARDDRSFLEEVEALIAERDAAREFAQSEAVGRTAAERLLEDIVKKYDAWPGWAAWDGGRQQLDELFDAILEAKRALTDGAGS